MKNQEHYVVSPSYVCCWDRGIGDCLPGQTYLQSHSGFLTGMNAKKDRHSLNLAYLVEPCHPFDIVVFDTTVQYDSVLPLH